MLNEYERFLTDSGKSDNTVTAYMLHIQGFIEWYKDSYGDMPTRLYRANTLDYIAYLRNIKKLTAKTINAKISALLSYNKYLIAKGVQEDIVVYKSDNIKIQQQYASLSIVTKQEVEQFRQTILINQGKRDYAIVTLLAYAGLRISEVLDLTTSNIGFVERELIVSYGKGHKQRVVYLNDKIINALKEYMQERNSTSAYLFVSRESDRINRTRINQIFNKYSDKITPHTLRHFYCSNALESGYSVHEVANQAGHSNIHTTLLYTNPNKEQMKAKANLL
ncbi:tyrosine-type recombinase/integrase [Acetanaerobacterium elongatum]|uniref:Site-specific recombinase XerD n=1 Tax=Acetanaerobacterium elongatum TaxID=258515 RepID=A0A1H0BNE4_9FIRM|nr:tyrosine-type recombinase/integrase [Acetanaerobacterium elongatum]SDN47169.1 Site-specific recombinase XerD [Acetanaerobacterium elongatum]